MPKVGTFSSYDLKMKEIDHLLLSKYSIHFNQKMKNDHNSSMSKVTNWSTKQNGLSLFQFLVGIK